MFPKMASINGQVNGYQNGGRSLSRAQEVSNVSPRVATAEVFETKFGLTVVAVF